jgi:hypothetical protein
MTPPRRIDLHTHFLPDGYREVLARHGQDTIAGTPGDPAPALRDLSEDERAQIDRGTAGDLLSRFATD